MCKAVTQAGWLYSKVQIASRLRAPAILPAFAYSGLSPYMAHVGQAGSLYSKVQIASRLRAPAILPTFAYSGLSPYMAHAGQAGWLYSKVQIASRLRALAILPYIRSFRAITLHGSCRAGCQIQHLPCMQACRGMSYPSTLLNT